MNTSLLKVAFVNNALYLPGDAVSDTMTADVAALLLTLNRHGYSVDEDCLRHLNALGHDDIATIVEHVREVYLADANWASLIRQWNERPTGVSFINYFITALANLAPELQGRGVTLPCGHFIPDGVFDLTRYNGCPFCGTPFVTAAANLEIHAPGDLKILRRWTLADAEKQASELIAMPTPLDYAKTTRLSNLLDGLPGEYFDTITDIPCVETRALVAAKFFEWADMSFCRFLKTPTDMLRTLWYLQTSSLRIIRPADAKKAEQKQWKGDFGQFPESIADLAEAKFKLHYTREVCRTVARWFDALDMGAEAICVNMHRYRQMWVRFIRALRLTEYARRDGLKKLAEVLDKFYNKNYLVWAGELDKGRMAHDRDFVLDMLRQRPGVFARCLFDTALDFGVEPVSWAFASVAPQLPVRLLVSLNNAVPGYFLPAEDKRFVFLPGGTSYPVSINPGLKSRSESSRRDIALRLQQEIHNALFKIYAGRDKLPGDSIYISPELYECPVPVGDRGNTEGRTDYAIPGQLFDVKGNKVRLFLHWGIGMPAQHYDMDLSCRLVGDYKTEDVAYYSLNVPGAMHSGDIQYIPDNVGAAEYIELDLPELTRHGFKYAVFTANAYSVPNLATDLVVGWMNSSYEMKVDDDTGVAFDPAHVQRMVNIGKIASDRGLIFGVLDIEARKIMWLELANNNRTLYAVDVRSVEALYSRLSGKMSIGELIALRAAALGQPLAASPANATAFTLATWPQADIL